MNLLRGSAPTPKSFGWVSIMLLSTSVVHGRARRFGYLVLAIASLACSALLRAQTPQPAIYGTPLISVPAHWYYVFQPLATPQEGLTFGIVNQPAWADFDPLTGQLSGTPTTDDIGTYTHILISASDGSSWKYLPQFSITVLPYVSAGSMPSGGPPFAAVVGQPYMFQLTTRDPSGARIALASQNKPDWLTFDRVNGLLFGTPGPEDVGAYPNFRLGATNGYSSVWVPFRITVQPSSQTPTGSATLSWLPPTQNTDGSVLTDLAGYRIYFGLTPDSLDQSVQITNAGISAYVIDGLAPGTWYFAVSAYDASGAESTLSPVISGNF
jgi:hypothetical protein